MYFNQPDEDFEKVEKLSQSLTFEDIKDDYEQFQKLIRKHNPDGVFRPFENVQASEGQIGLLITPSFAMVEFFDYLSYKYTDEIRARAVGEKIYKDYILKK